jgi:hypothetical protein
VIDFQLLGAGPPGLDLVQLYQGAFSNLDDIERVPELLDIYHKKLIENSPSWVAPQYTREMLEDDFMAGLFLFGFGSGPVINGMLGGLIDQPDHPFWGLMNAAAPRLYKLTEVLDVGSYLHRLMDT